MKEIADTLKKRLSELGQSIRNGSTKISGTDNIPENEEVRLPYLDGRYHFEQAILEVNRQRLRWQRIAYIAIVIALVAVVNVLVVTTSKNYHVYVAEIDRMGAVRLSVPVETYTPSPELTAAILRDAVRAIRVASSDQALQKEMIAKALAFLGGNAVSKYAEEVQRLGQSIKLRRVDRFTTVSLQQNDVWRIVWYEEELTEGVRRMSVKEGFFRVVRTEPNERHIEYNPLGIYIIDYEINTLNTR